MKMPKKLRSKKQLTLLVILGLIVVIGIGAGVYALKLAQDSKDSTSTTSDTSVNPSSKPQEVNLSPPTDEEVQTGNAIKEQTVKQDESSTPNTDSLSVVATTTGATVRIQTTITDSTQDGTCSLTLVKGGTAISIGSVGIQPLAGYSTCKGWDVPLSKLSPGEWVAKVTANYQSKQAQATTSVTIP